MRGQDVVRVTVQVLAGPLWWTRLFQLSECLLLGCCGGWFDVLGGGSFAAAVVGGVGGPVAGGGVLPGDGLTFIRLVRTRLVA